MGLLTQPGVTGADKYPYEDIAGAAKCVISTPTARKGRKTIKIACNLFVSLEEKKKSLSHKKYFFFFFKA